MPGKLEGEAGVTFTTCWGQGGLLALFYVYDSCLWASSWPMLEHHSQEFNSLLDSPTWMALDSTIPTHPNLNISEFPQELASHLRRLPFFSLPVSCRIFKKEIDQPLEKWPPGRFWSERRIGLRMQEACRAAGLEPWDPVLETGWVDFERESVWPFYSVY